MYEDEQTVINSDFWGFSTKLLLLAPFERSSTLVWGFSVGKVENF